MSSGNQSQTLCYGYLYDSMAQKAAEINSETVSEMDLYGADCSIRAENYFRDCRTGKSVINPVICSTDEKKEKMNVLENLLDKRAALLNDETEQNLFAFCMALLDAPLLIPCEFDFKDFDFGSPDPSMLKQGALIPWAGPEYKTAVAEREGRKWLQVFTDKTSMPEQYRTRCIPN